MKFLQIIELLKNEPEQTLDSMSQKDVKKIIEKLSNEYYNNNNSLISDQLFDYIVEYYNTTYKGSLSVGAPVPKSVSIIKVKLPYWLGSLDKIKPTSNTFEKWIRKYPGPYVISYKLDGVSALLYKSNGVVNLYTRGDGLIGQDISHCLNYINKSHSPSGLNLEHLIDGDAIRGELVISTNNFKKISDDVANARNGVSGIISKKTPDIDKLSLVDFVGYWVLNPPMKQSEQLEYIKTKNFTPRCVPYESKQTIDLEYLSRQMMKARTTHEYMTDGIVVIDDSQYYPQESGSSPPWGFAFKQLLTDQMAESTVVDVVWQISKDKYIKPRVQISPVSIGGVEITFATGFNAKFIVDNCIGVGAVIKIVRSGDVIPKIEQVIKPADTGKPKMPTIKYEWNDTGVDIMVSELDDQTLERIIIKKLYFFFTTLDIKGMAESTIEKFVTNGYDDLWKILQADRKKVEKIPGLGKTIVEKLYASIDNGLENRSLEEIMCASQIFGRGIGVKKFKLITSVYPNILDIYETKGSEHVKRLVGNINGFDTITVDKIVDGMGDFVIYLNEFLRLKPSLLGAPNETPIPALDLSNFTNKTLVFTGFRNKDLEKLLGHPNIGSRVSTSVSKNTDYVVAKDPSENSEKIVKARGLGIQIISMDDFYQMIGFVEK